ncbi:MAG: DUF1622 domain-containing protein [Tissierellia bacterium]|nr:DUF1622 domain-containing protein [Tissierellia bacterium]
MEVLTTTLELYLESLSHLAIVILEMIGIFFIIYGSVKALIQLIHVRLDFRDVGFKVILGESLATALQFKLGAEIIKTVLIRDMSELVIVGSIVLLRGIITFIIYWEINKNTCEV